jgi:DNA polymerase-1
MAGRPFNVGSPKQLGEILFDEMKLPGGKRSKLTGAWSTDASVLEELAAKGIPIARLASQHRQIQKLKSTYVDALARRPMRRGACTRFRAGRDLDRRLSSTEPNLQNIPIRTEEGARIRQRLRGGAGHLLVSADYSQIELRILGPCRRRAEPEGGLRQGRGHPQPHRGRHLPPRARQGGQGSPPPRQDDQFGIIYGMSAFGLAARLGIGPGEARGIIDAYFAQYPGIRDCMERFKEDAARRGYVETPFGRKLWIAEIGAKDPPAAPAPSAPAINAPFQGGAAEIIKRAMVRLPRRCATPASRADAAAGA